MHTEPNSRRPRREQVLETLREAIVAGRIEDGERLIEDKIARELKTSRGPVREALRQLEHEGFVVSSPYSGATVLGVSDEEVQQVLIPVRLVLETAAVPKAVERMDEDDFAELAKEIWQMSEAARTDDLQRSVDADMRFHELLLERAGQPHTAQVWRSIAPRIRAHFFRYGRTMDLHRIAAEHNELLATLQSRDEDAIVALLERHIMVRMPAPA